jgi:2-methylisocitrate lyase-like PEP mutase family enzyme
MEKRKTLRDLVAHKQIFAPCVWDVMSANAAEQAGFEATLLSGGALSQCVHGVPDIGLITADDLVRSTEYVCAANPLPCCIDADDGYGETPLHTYRTAQRLVQAGAMSFTLDDTTGFRGYNRWGMKFRSGIEDGKIIHPVVSRKVWLAKIKAALDACEGSDCMVIARTESKLQYGLDEAIDRCQLALKLGAEMTLIIGLKNLDEGKKVSTHVPGWKMWPDVQTFNGKPDVELADIEKLGFCFVTTHIFERAAMAGMIDFGKHCLQARSMVYHDTHRMGLSDDELMIHPIMGTMRKPRKETIRPDRWLSKEPLFWESLPVEK